METTIPIEPSDALGSTPLTIRNIAMGNLLPIAKSVSRRIRRDAGRRRRRRRHRTVWPAAVTNDSYLLHIWRSCARRRLASVANPVSRDRERPMNNRCDFHNRLASFRYVVLVTTVYVLFYDRIDWKEYIKEKCKPTLIRESSLLYLCRFLKKKNYFFNIKYKYKITFFSRGFILFLIIVI